jgi:hypothetical protein
MKQLISYGIIIAWVLFFFSCKKVNDTPFTPQQVDSVKIFGFDSTKLIKNLTFIAIDSMGNEIDSSTEYFYYDTLNKKIFASGQNIAGPNPPNYIYILSYNSSYQLSNFSYNTSFVQDADQLLSADYQYDAQNILSREVQTNKDGSKKIFDITKKMLPSGGYSLRGSNSNGQDSLVDTYTFAASGQLLSWSDTLEPGQVYTSDSLIYDTRGNVITVMENTTFFPTPFKRFEFSGRDTIGNELSSFNKVLFNGISAFSASSFSFIGSYLTGWDDYDFYQFTNYPAASTIVYLDYNNSFLTFDPNPKFDSKNRLASCKLFGNNGFDYFDIIKPSYYK